MNLGNATIIELAWTAGTLVGLIANAWGFFDAMADRQWLRSSGLNGRREIVSRWHVVLNGGLTYVQVAFLTAGVIACVTPSPQERSIQIVRAATQILFLTAEPVLVYVAIAARRYRGRLLASRRLLAASGAIGELEERPADEASSVPQAGNRREENHDG